MVQHSLNSSLDKCVEGLGHLPFDAEGLTASLQQCHANAGHQIADSLIDKRDSQVTMF
jgi:hypothetical protein